MSELARPPLEGKVIERHGITVTEMIEKLSAFDGNLLVMTSDCCYGYELDPEPCLRKVEGYELNYYPLKDANLKDGDQIVIIN